MTRFNYLIIIITLTAFVFSACAEKEAQPVLPELPEGLEIEDLVVGDGETAGESDFITVHYKGMLSNGDVFEDSRDIGQPATFQLGVGMLIDGWDIGLQGMKVGGQRRLVLQPELAYGEQGAGDVIPPNEELTFEIELLEVRKMPVSWEYDEADVQTMESGLMYVVMEEGSGDKPESGDRIRVNYSGYLEDGEMFDSSFIREDSFEFNVGTGAVIQGWDQGLLDMRPGEKRKLIIPASLAYGERGIGNVIPPNATLYFDVELVEVVE
ncbi:MAG: FKBP-type peptidyl-prolyl cis-trans isomerase [Rhodothermaceae bacterium]|nr:FKBP-type peptidyl-prolyl cis-trans isomerase [Rhodothermaceae bacterium]